MSAKQKKETVATKTATKTAKNTTAKGVIAKPAIAPVKVAKKAVKAPPLPPAAPVAKKAPKAPAIKTLAPPLPPKAEKPAKLPKGMTAPEPIQKPVGTRDNFGTLPDDKESNGIWYPRANSKHREMWDLVAKVQKSNKGQFPDRWQVMEAMHEANESRGDGDKFKVQSMSLQYHFCRLFHGIAGDREKTYKKRKANAVEREPKAPKAPKLPKAEKPAKEPKAPAIPKPAAKVAKKAPKLPKAPPLPTAPPLPPVAPPLPA